MLKNVEPVAEAHGLTLGQLFTAWLIHQPGITTALVGARNTAQVEENARAGDAVLDGDTLSFIRREVEALGALN